MEFRALACITLALAVSFAKGLNCAGRFSIQYDLWCQSSCNNQPPFCPNAFCQCSGGTPPLECSAIGPFSGLDDAWCNLNCNHEPPFCPEDHCYCGPVASPAPVAPIQPHENSCCEEDEKVLFYANGTSIYKLVKGFAPVVCYSFPIGEPTGLVIDEDGNLYVADPVAGTVSRMSVNCNDSSVVVISSWIRDGVIDRPTGIAIVPGQGLLVSGTVGLFSLTFRSDGGVFNVVRLPNIIFRVRDIEVVGQRAYFIHRDGEVLILDLSTNQIVTYIAIHQHNIPDYGGITINECGFFFTATDSNQVFFCPDINDGSVCGRYCIIDRTIDGTTCININQPTGISSGCCCDIFVSNSANGCLVHYPKNRILPSQSIEPQVGEVISCGLTHHQASVFYNPRRPAGSLCTDVCVGTTPQTPTRSPTPSSSKTPSFSTTPSTSLSPTSSRSATPSPSPTPSTSAKITGRLIPGVSIQASGGVQSASILTGAVTLTLVKCPPGVPASDAANCSPSSTNTFKIPVSQLSIHNLVGQPTSSSYLLPFITAVSANNTENQIAAVSLFHVAPIIRNGSSIAICDPLCLASRQGRILPDSCSSIPLSSTDVQSRTRQAISVAAGGATVDSSNLPNQHFQSASIALCDGEVIGEFSVSLFGSGTSSAVVNIASLPRLNIADRCNSTLSVGARLCYDTTQNPSVHGVFGDEQNLVCVADFLIRRNDTGFQEYDDRLSLLSGDIIDTSFRVTQNVRPCPFESNNNTRLAALCNKPTTRIVGFNECDDFPIPSPSPSP